jgi:hypothetical protein
MTKRERGEVMSDELQELWVRCRHLEAINADLLEALEECVSWYENNDWEMVNRARAAIAKAREL